MCIFKYVHFYNLGMSLESIPDNWIDLLETDDMVKSWHRDTQNGTLPTTDVHKMISYLEKYYPEDCKRMVAEPNGLPQSFVYWWCHRLVDAAAGSAPGKYPVLTHWTTNIAEDHKELCPSVLPNDVLVITVMTTWMDILFTDIILFDNEDIRSKIPRMYCNKRLRCGSQTVEPSSRRNTLKYIMQGGLSIFRERGFKEGEEYWKHLCKKYKI